MDEVCFFMQSVGEALQQGAISQLTVAYPAGCGHCIDSVHGQSVISLLVLMRALPNRHRALLAAPAASVPQVYVPVAAFELRKDIQSVTVHFV